MNIAFVGPMRSGKTTAATYLVEQHGYTRLALADPVKDEVMWACNGFITHHLARFPDRQDSLGMAGQPPILIDRQEMEDAKDIFRPILQWWGTDFARQYLKNNRIWIDIFLDCVKHTIGPIVCDDVRFPNEADALREAGFRIIRIDRPEESRHGERTFDARETTLHASETALTAIVPDTTITNTEDLTALYGRINVAVSEHG